MLRDAHISPPKNKKPIKLYIWPMFTQRTLATLALIIGFALASINTYAQTKYTSNDPILEPIAYRSADNPYYWKNRMPHPGYWQQDVEYTIKANIDETTDIIDGELTLKYYNNSPHDLPNVFFHLYQNMTMKGGYLENLTLNNNTAVKYGKYEEKGLGTVIESLDFNGTALTPEIDFTVMKVNLPQPIKSGESATFKIKFKTYFDSGSQRRRMKKFDAYGNTHYDGVHWYPRICVYDRKFGWDTDQHLGKEFYGDFGSYDVELTFSDNYVVEATGILLNKSEVMPADLRARLDIKNFLRKPWEEKPTVITPYNKDKRKTWKYYGVNVHDFAFTADPTYRIDERTWNGIQIVAVVQEPHAAGWYDAAEFTKKVIQVYSRDFGMYAYPKMVVADARDGMEYPMLTLDGGFTPDYHGLLAHEVGHNWFFGMVGNNETYRAALDEGFTQFLTAWALEAIDGDTLLETMPRNKYVLKHTRKDLARDSRVYYPYIADAVKMDETTLNTHSDCFNAALGHGGGYRNVYFKTATMLYNLQYTLGDSLFLASMQHYFSQWKIAHPYFDDFRNSIINFTKVDLNWFFDQWLETSKTIDYAIVEVEKEDDNNIKDQYEITFERKGRMHMPIDFTITANDGKVYNYYIPNTWYPKKTTATVLPKWYGWDKLNPTYEAVVTIPSGIKTIQIDPTHRLADNNILDNSKGIKKADVYFDSQIPNMPNWRKREVYWRPEIWGNTYDFLKVGAHFNGNYMTQKHRWDFTFWVATWFNGNPLANDAGFENAIQNRSAADRFNFRFNYANKLDRINKGLNWDFSLRYLDGLALGKVGIDQLLRNGNTKLLAFVKVFDRLQNTDWFNSNFNYLYNPQLWGRFAYPIPITLTGPESFLPTYIASQTYVNSTLNLGVEHKYSTIKSTGTFTATARGGWLGGTQSYAQLTLQNLWNVPLGKKLNLKTRLFGQFGTGYTPMESALYIAGGNPEQMMENKYMRARGFFPVEWAQFGNASNHLAFGGGLGLRGFTGALIDIDGVRSFAVQNGVSFNGELEFDQLVKWKPKKISDYFKLNTYAFVDMGAMSRAIRTESWGGFTLTKSGPAFLADAGLGAALTIKRWGNLYNAKPLTIRADFPLWVSRTATLEDSQNFKFRWMIGVNRAF